MPIEVSHILLRRPWVFYRRFQRDGYENTYALIHKGRKKVLHPIKDMLSSKKLEHAQPQKVLTMHQFERESMETKIIFSLMIKESKESKEQDKEYLVIVHNILNDFSNLWPRELPNQLPSLLDVQHVIDLIPSASLPNLPAYRMNPREHAELKRQVDEKGLFEKA